MFEFNKEQFMGFLRHVITFVGGLIVAKGHLDPATIETVGGAIIALVGVLWSIFTPEKQPDTAATVMSKLGPAKTAAVKQIIAAPAVSVKVPQQGSAS